MNGEHKASGGGVRPLLKESDFAAALGVSERKFKEMRATGVIPEPIELGPRAHRWTHDDFAEALSRLPRAVRREEPIKLSEGRRARIEALKAAGAGAQA